MSALVTITRSNTNVVNLEFKCPASKALLRVALTPEQYGMLLTGMSEVEGECTHRNLLRWGTTRVIEHRSCSVELNFPDAYVSKPPTQQLLEDYLRTEYQKSLPANEVVVADLSGRDSYSATWCTNSDRKWMLSASMTFKVYCYQ